MLRADAIHTSRIDKHQLGQKALEYEKPKERNLSPLEVGSPSKIKYSISNNYAVNF